MLIQDMSLPPGEKLGPYEIVGCIGKGGMGEVYRARDVRLGRDIALKILPPEVAQDGARQVRFEQEARAASALNHPNIVCVYDIGREGGTLFIVSELVEGESLRIAIGHGSMSADNVAALGTQIAEGIAAAHAAGIVHRDLKPENIMLARDGRVKILDFGLAKRSHPPQTEGDSTETLTQPGAVLGTVGYMSPEQVRAQPVDRRSDIFSIGAVLYEMASGRRAFTGDTPVSVMHAILKDNPPELPANCKPLERIVRRCLEKEPGRRFQTASDLAFALQNLSSASVGAVVSASTWSRTAVPWLGAAALVVALSAGAIWWATGKASPPPPPAVLTPPAVSTARSNPAGGGDSNPAPTTRVSRNSPEAPPVGREVRNQKALPSPVVPKSTGAGAPNVGQKAQAANDEGDRLASQGSWAEALTAYDEAIRLRPDYADAYASRCRVYGFLNQQRRGVQDCDEAIRLKPDSARAYFNRGSRYFILRQNEAAVRDFSEAMRLVKPDAHVYQARGQAYFLLGQYDQAVQDFDECIRLDPNNEAPFVLRGTAFNSLKQYQRAIQDFNEAIRLKPDDANVYNQRAFAEEKFGDGDRAVKDRQYARELSAAKK